MVFRLGNMDCQLENWVERIPMERRKLSHKFKEFQRAILLVNKGIETSSS